MLALRHRLCCVLTEAILRMTSSVRGDEISATHSATKRLAGSSRDLGILGLPPEKMVLVREKKDDIEKVVCCHREIKVTLGKDDHLYSDILCTMYISKRSGIDHTQFYLQIHHACLSFISVHQMALLLTELTDIQLQLTAHLLTPKG